MILGDRCTRACGFCLVDTRKPLAGRSRRAATGRRRGRARSVSRTPSSRAWRATTSPTAARRCSRRPSTRSAPTSPDTAVELLISDCKGDAASLATIFDARPDVLNHNLETVARLQRAARPSAGYARSLAVLGRAKDAGLVTKSGIILGMGETDRRGARPRSPTCGRSASTSSRSASTCGRRRSTCRSCEWWHPDEFAALGEYARGARLRARRGGPARALELPRPRGRTDRLVSAPRLR